jgi:hypothetical protein
MWNPFDTRVITIAGKRRGKMETKTKKGLKPPGETHLTDQTPIGAFCPPTHIVPSVVQASPSKSNQKISLKPLLWTLGVLSATASADARFPVSTLNPRHPTLGTLGLSHLIPLNPNIKNKTIPLLHASIRVTSRNSCKTAFARSRLSPFPVPAESCPSVVYQIQKITKRTHLAKLDLPPGNTAVSQHYRPISLKNTNPFSAAETMDFGFGRPSYKFPQNCN